MKYLEVVNSGIEVEIWYCERHKEYFSNNCSECMLDANDPDTRANERKIIGEWLEGKLDNLPAPTSAYLTDFYTEVARLKLGQIPDDIE